MNIICDIDGILRDITPSLIQCYIDDFHPDPAPTVADITVYNMDQLDAFKEMGSFRDFARQHAEEIFVKSEPYPGALEALRDLGNKHYIHLATAQDRSNIKLTLDWLEKHDVYFDSLSFVDRGDNKCNIHGHVLIDDCTANLEVYKKHGVYKNIELITIDRTWNQDWTGARFNKMSEIVKHLS